MDREPSPRRLREPAPIWPETPRLLPVRDFPPYRFVLGLNPHPTRSPDGHSHGDSMPPSPLLAPERWRECEDYLFGIDLYHQSYFWEAHEVWEGLWQQAESGSVQAQFLRGLIQTSAALLKLHSGNPRGAVQINRKAVLLLTSVRDSGEGDCYMGIDVVRLVADLARYFSPLEQESEEWRPEGRPPRLGTW